MMILVKGEWLTEITPEAERSRKEISGSFLWHIGKFVLYDKTIRVMRTVRIRKTAAAASNRGSVNNFGKMVFRVQNQH